MQEFYITYKVLIVAAILCGIYLPSIEKLYGSSWYIRALKYLYVLPAFTLSSHMLTCLKFVLFDGEEKLEIVLQGAIVLVYSFFSFFTSFSFYCNAVNFEKLFALWESLFQQEFFAEQRQALLDRNRKFALNWLKKFGGISMSCTVLYGLSLYFSPEKKLDHPTGIPFRNQSPDFELVVTLEFFVAYFGFFTMIVYDSLTMVLVSMEEAQFVHLKKSLRNVLEFISVTDSGAIQVRVSETSKENLNELDGNSPLLKEKFEETEKLIQIWIYHHKQLIQFHEELKRIFLYPFAVKFLVLVLIICLFFFLVVTGIISPVDVSISIVFCANIYATFYVTISFADSTRETAESMFDEAFDKSWYLLPKKLKTGFVVILMRCHRPVIYTALKIYPLTAASFLKIFTSAYTFFTFLLQINWKKKRELNEPVSNFSRIRQDRINK